MSRDNHSARIEAIFRKVFELAPAAAISDATRRGELERWDSIGHLELLEALRNEFSIEIPPDQALEMETMSDVKRVIGSLSR